MASDKNQSLLSLVYVVNVCFTFAFLRKLHLLIFYINFHAHIPTVHSFPVHPLSHKHEYSLSPSIHFPCCPQKTGATWSSTINLLFLGSQSSISGTREKCLNFYLWLSWFTLLYLITVPLYSLTCWFLWHQLTSIIVPGSLYYLSFWTSTTHLNIYINKLNMYIFNCYFFLFHLINLIYFIFKSIAKL